MSIDPSHVTEPTVVLGAGLAESNCYARGPVRGVYIELVHHGDYESGSDLAALAAQLRVLASEVEGLGSGLP